MSEEYYFISLEYNSGNRREIVVSENALNFFARNREKERKIHMTFYKEIDKNGYDALKQMNPTENNTYIHLLKKDRGLEDNN